MVFWCSLVPASRSIFAPSVLKFYVAVYMVCRHGGTAIAGAEQEDGGATHSLQAATLSGAAVDTGVTQEVMHSRSHRT